MSAPTAALAGNLLELASRLAVEAGHLAAAGRQADAEGGDLLASIGSTTKSTATDIVTRHDKAAEQLIVSGIAAARPDDTIIGEEGTDHRGGSGIEWYLDPIDGTSNFLYGLPMWSTSIAAVDGDGALAGAVYVPATDELFAARRGGGATCNGTPIHASAQTELALAMVGTGFSYRAERRAEQGRRVAELLAQIRDVRRMGSAAIDLVYTAAGRLDAYFEEHLNRWDMAAGELIAREAGCRSGDFTGGPPAPEQLLVGGPGVFGQLQQLLGSWG